MQHAYHCRPMGVEGPERRQERHVADCAQPHQQFERDLREERPLQRPSTQVISRCLLLGVAFQRKIVETMTNDMRIQVHNQGWRSSVSRCGMVS